MVFSLPGKPQGRGRVERFFLTVNQRLLSILPGYCPAGFSRTAKPTLRLADLDAQLKRFFLDDYHRNPHSATGTAPVTRWNTGGFLPRMPDAMPPVSWPTA